MEEGRDDEGAKPDSRPGRVDSLANFQIYTLAVRSRAGCFEEREGRKGAASGHWTGTMVGILLGFLHAHNARFSSRACVCACHCLQELASLSPPLVLGKFRGARTGWKFDLRDSNGMTFVKSPRPFGSPRFNAPITMRMKAVVSSWDVGWIKKGIYFGFPSFPMKLFQILLLHRWNYDRSI